MVECAWYFYQIQSISLILLVYYLMFNDNIMIIDI